MKKSLLDLKTAASAMGRASEARSKTNQKISDSQDRILENI